MLYDLGRQILITGIDISEYVKNAKEIKDRLRMWNAKKPYGRINF